MSHLTSAKLAALLEGSLPVEEIRALAAHLEQPCPRCEALLEAEGPELETLCALLEAESAWEGEERLPAPHRERLAQEILPTPRRSWRIPGGLGAVVALAAALLIFLRPGPPEPGGLKGAELSPPGVELRVVAAQEQGDSLELLGLLSDGDQAQRQWTLLFEIHSDRAAARSLFVVDGASRLTLLYPPAGALPELEAGGRRAVSVGSSRVALDLGDMEGPLTLVAAASALALDPVDGVLRPWQAGAPLEGVGYDSLRLELAP